MFFRGARAPVGSSVQGGVRDESLGPGFCCARGRKADMVVKELVSGLGCDLNPVATTYSSEF